MASVFDMCTDFQVSIGRLEVSENDVEKLSVT